MAGILDQLPIEDIKKGLNVYLKWPVANKVALHFGVVAAISAAFYFGLYDATKIDIARLKTKFAELDKRLVEAEALGAQRDKFLDEINRLRDAIAEAQTRLPLQAKMNEFINQVTRIGKDNGIVFTNVAPKKEEPIQFYAKIPLYLEMEGRYHGLGIFFNELANQQRIINLTDVTMESGKGAEAGESLLKVKATATTFRFLKDTEQEEAAKAAKTKKGGKK